MTALNYGNQFCKVTVNQQKQTHKTVGFGYRTSGIATTPIVQAPTFVCGLKYYFPPRAKKCYAPIGSKQQQKRLIISISNRLQIKPQEGETTRHHDTRVASGDFK
jgi:hypothetical protein